MRLRPDTDHPREAGGAGDRPDAFVIVCDAHEILGEGFGVYAPGGLKVRP